MSFTQRRILIPLAVAFAILVPTIQVIGHLGLSAGEFSASGDDTLRAAGYAFSIWSLIYAGLLAYAVWQALPRNADDRTLAALAGPSVIAIAGCGLWIIASAADWKWASVVIILASAAAIVAGLLRNRRAPGAVGFKDRLLVWWPLGLLAGWLTIASALNILTVLTAKGLIGRDLAAPAAILGIVAAVAAALAVTLRTRLVAYAVPIAWGLVAVWVAERADKPLVAGLALAAAVVVAAGAAWSARPHAARAREGRAPDCRRDHKV